MSHPLAYPLRAACLVSGSVIGVLSHCVGQMPVEERDVRPDVPSSQHADDNSDFDSRNG